ncbi:hypothetical protein C8R44DRAFT_854503 [Mycena epipterygia]|nr:hypothetical protein C8R44DRAFT_854503 [Mycena epipterygia]
MATGGGGCPSTDTAIELHCAQFKSVKAWDGRNGGLILFSRFPKFQFIFLALRQFPDIPIHADHRGIANSELSPCIQNSPLEQICPNKTAMQLGEIRGFARNKYVQISRTSEENFTDAWVVAARSEDRE